MTAACHGHGFRSYASLSFRYLSTTSEQQLDCASPSPRDSFRFFADVGRELCFAESVFFDGKLVPVGLPPPPPASIPPADHDCRSAARQRPQGRSAKRSELRRPAPSDSKSSAPTTGSMTRPVRWHLLALGGARVPATMEMRNIRSRQRRRRRTPTPTPTPAPAEAAAAKGSGVWRSEGKDVSWRILRSLSCNAEGSSALAVAPRACYVPHVRGGAA